MILALICIGIPLVALVWMVWMLKTGRAVSKTDGL
jgi:hypothetical protein